MRSYPGMRRVPLRHRGAYNLGFCLERFFPKSDRVRSIRTTARQRVVDDVRRGGKGRVFQVDRRRDLTPAEFRKHYLARRIPVVIEGAAASWPAMQNWSFAEFDRRFGQETITLLQRKGATEPDVEIAFGDFLKEVVGGGRRYLRYLPLLERFPELLTDFDHTFFQQMVRSRLGMSFQLFVGGGGTTTPFHNEIVPFLYLNVAGTKRWSFVSNHYLAVLDPNGDEVGYNDSPAAIDCSNPDVLSGIDCVDRMEAETRPGDLLYVPPWIWHYVRNESPTIAVRCGFMDPRGMLTESTTLAFIRLFAARNPTLPEWLYYSFIKRTPPEQSRFPLTPKWYKA